MVQGRLERRSCVSDGESDKLYSPPMFLELPDEVDVLVGLGLAFFFTSQVPAESDLDDDESAKFLVEGCRVWGGGVGYPPGVYEVRGCALASGMKSLGFVVGKDPVRDTSWGRRILCVACGGGEIPRFVPWVLIYIRVSWVTDGGVVSYRVEPVCVGAILLMVEFHSLRRVR